MFLEEIKADMRAARGAAWLDKHKPGWENDVNPATVNLASDYSCVIGQAFSPPWREMRSCGMTRTATPFRYAKIGNHIGFGPFPIIWMFRRGFMPGGRWRRNDPQRLAWERLISARRAKATLLAVEQARVEKAERPELALSA